MDEKITLPKEKLKFADTDRFLNEERAQDKPIGYFKDALIRFRKNKASSVAAIIIICILLFAIILPFFNFSGTGTYATTRYQRKVPRSLTLSKIGLCTGDKRLLGINEATLIQNAAIGIGALQNYGEVGVGDAIASGDLLQPISKITGTQTVRQGRQEILTYDVKIDDYLRVGFVYLYLDREEYERILAWQESEGVQVLYPLINENEYNFATVQALSENANWWYKTDGKARPVRINNEGEAELIKYDSLTALTLEDNYMRNEDGELVYWTYSGGGDEGTAMYRVRALFYNYYRYTHGGRAPEFLFGTDSAGYDLAYRMAIGLRLSLLISVSIFIINFIIGAVYGAIEGYYGGRSDLIMEFVAYILSGIPFMVVATLFQIHLSGRVGPIPSLLFAFVLTGWLGVASRVRTQFYRFKNQEYVMAARTLGARDGRIIWKHIFPNTLGTIITASVLTIPGVIFSESMLSYLGIINLGTSTTTSLGTLLSDASGVWTEAPHLMFFPALFISLLMICFNLFGNGLRDAFNPSLRGAVE